MLSHLHFLHQWTNEKVREISAHSDLSNQRIHVMITTNTLQFPYGKSSSVLMKPCLLHNFHFLFLIRWLQLEMSYTKVYGQIFPRVAYYSLQLP